jgi:hypothetical protein
MRASRHVSAALRIVQQAGDTRLSLRILFARIVASGVMGDLAGMRDGIARITLKNR